eukprot:2893157-Lingulodinium_polyedra.AAC.1
MTFTFHRLTLCNTCAAWPPVLDRLPAATMAANCSRRWGSIRRARLLARGTGASRRASSVILPRQPS